MIFRILVVHIAYLHKPRTSVGQEKMLLIDENIKAIILIVLGYSTMMSLLLIFLVGSMISKSYGTTMMSVFLIVHLIDMLIIQFIYVALQLLMVKKLGNRNFKFIWRLLQNRDFIDELDGYQRLNMTNSI